MKKLKCTVSYDGTNFSGFQIQPDKRTIQKEIELAIKKIHKGNPVRIVSSGRTDAGVHAIGQVFHFETELNIPSDNWKKALNALLPKDVHLKNVEEVSLSFHARFDAIEKEYRYFVLNSKERDVFQRNYSLFTSENFNMKAIQEACKVFEGTHDFTSFCSARSTVKGTKERTLYEVSCIKQNDMMQFILRGDGFLYNMVRIIVGALLDVGRGKLTLEEIEAIFKKKDRSFVGKTLPPEGLYLWQVKYDSNYHDVK